MVDNSLREALPSSKRSLFGGDIGSVTFECTGCRGRRGSGQVYTLLSGSIADKRFALFGVGIAVWTRFA